MEKEDKAVDAALDVKKVLAKLDNLIAGLRLLTGDLTLEVWETDGFGRNAQPPQSSRIDEAFRETFAEFLQLPWCGNGKEHICIDIPSGSGVRQTGLECLAVLKDYLFVLGRYAQLIKSVYVGRVIQAITPLYMNETIADAREARRLVDEVLACHFAVLTEAWLVNEAQKEIKLPEQDDRKASNASKSLTAGEMKEIRDRLERWATLAKRRLDFDLREVKFPPDVYSNLVHILRADLYEKTETWDYENGEDEPDTVVIYTRGKKQMIKEKIVAALREFLGEAIRWTEELRIDPAIRRRLGYCQGICEATETLGIHAQLERAEHLRFRSRMKLFCEHFSRASEAFWKSVVDNRMRVKAHAEGQKGFGMQTCKMVAQMEGCIKWLKKEHRLVLGQTTLKGFDLNKKVAAYWESNKADFEAAAKRVKGDPDRGYETLKGFQSAVRSKVKTEAAKAKKK